MEESIRNKINKNAVQIIQKSNGDLNYQHLILILKSLNLTTPNLFNLDVSFSLLNKICTIDSRYLFSDIEQAIEKIFTINKVSPFLSSFSKGGKGHKISSFLLTNHRFEENPIYGIFAGLSYEIQNRLTLQINEENPSYHPLLAISLICIVTLNRISEDLKKVKGLVSFCKNLRLLTSNQDWKTNFEKLLYEGSQNSQKKPYSVHAFILDIKQERINTKILSAPQKSLINKLVQLKGDADVFHQLEDSPSGFKTDDIEILPDSKETKGGLVLEHDELIDKEEDGLETQNNLFLNTVTHHRNEKEAQNILFTNKNILPPEIQRIENEIHADTFNLKTRLCWALMLYYSIPVENIRRILLGTPQFDFSFKQMTGKIVIDQENEIVFLPTPIQILKQNSNDIYLHTHMPLPLEKTVGFLLKKLNIESIINKSLFDVLSQTDIEQAKSFKKITGFRQYRMTARKVSDTLWHYVLNDSQDEVKTAYLQGGAYSFIHMGCYYTNLNINALVDQFIETSKKVFKKSFYVKNDSNSAFFKDRIGSQRSPSLNALKTFLNLKFKTLIKRKEELTSSDDFWSFHNEISLYTITLLNLSSSHRPNTDPYYSVLNFIEEDYVQITEKVVMEGFEGRLAVLNENSRKQLNHYLTHLKQLVTIFNLQGSNVLAGTIENLITSKINLKENIPLFFTVTNGVLNKITRTTLSEYCTDEVELYSNFNRHFFSSKLAELNTPRYLIATQMGHVSKGKEPFSLNSNLSPDVFKERILPAMNKMFEELDLQIISPLDVANDKSFKIQEFSFKKTMLGPFLREEQRNIELSKKDIKSINILLLGQEDDKRNLYIDAQARLRHVELVEQQKQFNQYSHKVMFHYYLYNEQHNNWFIKTENKLSKSPFDQNFGEKYYQGKKRVNAIRGLINDFLNNKLILNQQEEVVLFSLSALVSGSVIDKQQLISICNTISSNYSELKISLVVELTDEKGNIRCWILNSLSLAVFKKLAIKTRLNVNDETYTKILKNKFNLSNLTKLINTITSFQKIYLPSFVTEYTSKKQYQSSIGIKGYKALFGDYADLNTTNETSISQEEGFEKIDLPKNSSNDSFVILKDFSKLLSQHKENNSGQQKTLGSIKIWLEDLVSNSPLELASLLLIKWTMKRLAENHLKVSSVHTYFSKIYPYIDSNFKDLKSFEALNNEVLKDKIYPKILKDMAGDYQQSTGEIPYSALTNFHNYLAEEFGCIYLIFIGRRVESIASIYPVILEEQYQACLKAIELDPETSSALKRDLKISLIFYKRLGLRKNELFKIQLKDVCLESKTIHISGKNFQAEKSSLGNRIIPYHQLLTKTEISLFESLVKKEQVNKQHNFLLFALFIEEIGELTVRTKISRYLTLLIRSVTKDPNISIKSMRKSFASEIFLKICLGNNYQYLLNYSVLKQAKLPINLSTFFNESSPINQSWLLADWIGHSTPKTTFEYYCLTMDLAVFAYSEAWQEKQPDYMATLKTINGKHAYPSFVYKNLNRYKMNKFTRFHAKNISSLETPVFQSGKVSYLNLFKLKLNTDDIQKILALFRAKLTPKKIDEFLSLESLTSVQVIKGFHSILQQDKNIMLPEKLIFNCIDSLIWWRYESKTQQLTELRVPQITKASLNKSQTISQKDLEFLLKIWKKELFRNELNTGNFVIGNQLDLEGFLCIYDEFQCHSSIGGYLQITLTGVKNKKEEILSITTPDYIKIFDKRKVSEEHFPISSFNIRISYRDQNAKVKGTCSYGVNSIIFLLIFLNLHIKH